MKTQFLTLLATLLICSFFQAQTKQIEFDKVIGIYADEAKSENRRNYNIDNEQDNVVLKTKKEFFQKDCEGIDAIIKSASEKHLTKELNYEQSIDFLKKELTGKFPSLDE